MSNSNRVQRFAAIAFSLALTASVFGLLGDLVSRHWQRVHEANAAYQKNAEYDRDKSADEIAQTCNDMTAIKFRECIRENLEAHYSDQSTNEDLQAQQDMAFWAMLLLFVSILGVIISTAGVALLISTIRQGQVGLDRAAAAVKVAQAANQIMLDEQRPWVSIHPQRIRSTKVHSDRRGDIVFSLLLRNSGSSPAILVHTKSWFWDAVNHDLDRLSDEMESYAPKFSQVVEIDGVDETLEFMGNAIAPNGDVEVLDSASFHLSDHHQAVFMIIGEIRCYYKAKETDDWSMSLVRVSLRPTATTDNPHFGFRSADAKELKGELELYITNGKMT